jgi:hypothetical protein
MIWFLAEVFGVEAHAQIQLPEREAVVYVAA